MQTYYSYLIESAATNSAQLKCEIEKQFLNLYGSSTESVQFFFAPARINIIGEHIDYNGGKVLPAAIDKYIFLAIRRRADTVINYDDIRFPGRFTFTITDTFSYRKENDYCNYLNGIITILKDKGFTLDTGFDALFFSCIPDGGGVSSSSALECCFVAAMNSLYNGNLTPVENALIGQETEHRFMNVQCGIMDQFIIATGKKDNAVLLDCATLEYEYVPLHLGDYRFVVMNTNKKRRLTDSKYNERVAECKEGLSLLNKTLAIKKMPPIENPCAITEEHLEMLKEMGVSDVIFRRMRHCLTENNRVYKAAEALRARNLETLGKLMNESHESLQTDYETTGRELDTLHSEANKIKGCLGSRVTGAGFGGCAIALLHKDCINEFIQTVGSAYKKKIGYEATFFECSTGNGAGTLE